MERQEKTRTARPPKLPQRALIRAAGLNPWEWLVLHQNSQYLYIVDRGMEQRKDCIIDRASKKVVGVSVSGREQKECPGLLEQRQGSK